MRVAHRLFLAVVPAVLGVFTVAGLAYWGARYRQAPGWLVMAAAGAALLSLALAWQNTRYVARRIERLAGGNPTPRPRRHSALSVVKEATAPGAGAALDEIDSIESVVDRLSGAVTLGEAETRERQAEAAARIREYGTLLTEASAAGLRQLTEAQLPIHILLEGHFGALNPNQEELLVNARTALDAVDLELRRLVEIAELDHGASSLRRESVRIGDLLGALRPQLEADAERAGVELELQPAPGLPRVSGNRVRLQQALELLLRHLIRRTAAGDRVTIEAAGEQGQVTIAITGAPPPTLDPDVALSRRILTAHGASLEHEAPTTRIRFSTTEHRAQ